MTQVEQQIDLKRDVDRLLEILAQLRTVAPDAPIQKISELEKVLKSDFFNTVKNVYETIYNSVDIPGANPEVKANATAKATIAAFSTTSNAVANSNTQNTGSANDNNNDVGGEGKKRQNSYQIRTIEIPKIGNEGLGFNIMGGQEQNSPIFISRVIPGGLADRCRTAETGNTDNRLQKGDLLIAVNGVNVEGETHERTVELLKAAKGSVCLQVTYAPELLEELERRFSRT